MRSDRKTMQHVQQLALVYIALAYGTDRQLSTEEEAAIVKLLRSWATEASEAELQEAVDDAVSTYLEEDAPRAVAEAVSALGEALTDQERAHALDDLVQIAEADGILLGAEQSLISMLAEAWEVKVTDEELYAHTTSAREEVPMWSLLHDLALVYVVVAHSTDDDLSSAEIDAILESIEEWQPEPDAEEARSVMRGVLKVYASEPDPGQLKQSVGNVGASLSFIQRLIVLDDLYRIAHADGEVMPTEKEMIKDLARAWGLTVHVNGQGIVRK